MQLHELLADQELILQIVWGAEKIEFHTKMLKEHNKGIFVTPYIHNDHPLELNITTESDVLCHLFADDTSNGKRVSWRNINLSTTKEDGAIVYYLSTSSFNQMSNNDDRRLHARTAIHKMGTASDKSNGESFQVMVSDLSDNGISFYAPSSFAPHSNNLTISFTDYIKAEPFHISVKCQIVHTSEKVGTRFYGCKLLETPRDYLIYGCIKRLDKNNN